MQYLLDTNILLHYIRNSATSVLIEEKYNLFGQEDKPQVISAVTVGEIRSIALQNNWGKAKINRLEEMLTRFILVSIKNEQIFNRYAEIDAFSQNKLTDKPLNNTARNMGKNDLWIAATASVLGISLLTSDKDFAHLDVVFNQLNLVV